MSSGRSYLASHPELTALVGDFVSEALLRAPEDLFAFAQQHFAQYAARYNRKSMQFMPLVFNGPSAVGKGRSILID